MFRAGPPSTETASTSYPSNLPCWRGKALHSRAVNVVAQAAAKHQAQRRKADGNNIGSWAADTAPRPEVKAQVMDVMSSVDLPAYIPLSEAQEVISEAVVDANSGQQELRLLNYTVNCALVGLSTALAASQLFHPDTLAAWPTLVSVLSSVAQKGAEYYNYIIDVHPIATKAVISGTVFGLGDLTAQTYEGRSWREVDASRIIRSSLCGFLAHGPLSHFFYEKLDRTFILSPYFDGGDAWYTPLAKIAIDQTLFAASFNTLYYFMLGALKLESPGVILNTVKSSWWELLKAGWRVWPIIHIATYTLIPVQDRLLWVDMCELAWVTVLSYYGQQKREKAGAAACAIPSGGGIFTDDILRGMSVESQITFQSVDGVPVTKQLDEVLVEAALMEANFGQYLDNQDPAEGEAPAKLPPIHSMEGPGESGAT